MKIELLIQMLFGTIILGTLGFLAKASFEMRGSLSGVAEKVEQTELRVSRIADVLPDVRSQVAWEEVQGPISGFVTVTNPEEQSPGRWKSIIKVYDARSDQFSEFQVTKGESERDLARYLVAGRVRTEGAADSSFHELIRFSNAERVAVSLPAEIDTNASFVIRSRDMEDFSEFL
ncbi:MAG: hypothetical protein ACXIUZ_08790 [Lysobacteraceae bacterium]